MAIKKAIFKTSAFFKGFLLPLAEDATAREAVIVGSILAKMSINNLESAAAIMKLVEMPYQVGNGYFLKTMLAKRYTLPTKVVQALVQFFVRYEQDHEEMYETMPVMWHQTLYTLVSSYRPYLSEQDVLSIKSLVKKQFHYLITPEVRKALASSQHEAPLNSEVMDLE